MQYFVIPLRLVHNILISNSKKQYFKFCCCINKNRVKNPKNSKNGPNLRRLWSSSLIIAKRRICNRSNSPALHYSAEFFEVCSIICHYLCGGSPYWSIEFRIILGLFREPRHIWWSRKVFWRPASVYKLGPALILVPLFDPVDKEETSRSDSRYALLEVLLHLNLSEVESHET